MVFKSLAQRQNTFIRRVLVILVACLVIELYLVFLLLIPFEVVLMSRAKNKFKGTLESWGRMKEDLDGLQLSWTTVWHGYLAQEVE